MIIKKKSFVLVLLIFFISTFTCFAALKYEEITVFYRDIRIFVNNEEIDLEDRPFIYENKTYVPLRFLSESLNSFVSWDNKNSTVSISSYVDFEETNPLAGERFVYGEIISPLNKKERTLHIFQHIDDNSINVEKNLKVAENVIIILKRNNKKINLDFEDLKIGDVVGMVINEDNQVRGIIIDI